MGNTRDHSASLINNFFPPLSKRWRRPSKILVALFFVTMVFLGLQVASQHQISHLLVDDPSVAISSFSKSRGKEHPQKQSLASLKSQSLEAPNEPTTPQYHVVFSTSCSEQQHWESMVFFYHAFKVKQQGTVTRIVSGCVKAKQEEEQRNFFIQYIQPLNPSNFFIHFTPDFAKVHPTTAYGGTYKYMNKRKLVARSYDGSGLWTFPFFSYCLSVLSIRSKTLDGTWIP